MAEAAQPGLKPHPRSHVPVAFRDAGLTALIALGVFLPLIGFQTINNIHNEIVLTTRWPLLFALVAIIGCGRLCYALAIDPWLRRRAIRPVKAEVPAWRSFVGKWFVPFAIGFVTGYVLGTRAGRQRYEQLKRIAKSISENPQVKHTTEAMQSQAAQLRAQATRKMQERAGAVSHDLREKMVSRLPGGPRLTCGRS